MLGLVKLVCCFIIYKKMIEKVGNDNNDNDFNYKEMIGISNISKRGNTNNDSLSSIDIKGAITLAAAITSFLVALSYSSEYEATSYTLFISFLSIGTISLLLFAIIERRSKSL